MATKEFHLGDILSVSTQRLLSPTKMNGLKAIMSFLVGYELSTLQLMHPLRVCQVHLFYQLPWLLDIHPQLVTNDKWDEWLQGLIDKYGEYHTIEALPPGSYNPVDPVEVLQQHDVSDIRVYEPRRQYNN